MIKSANVVAYQVVEGFGKEMLEFRIDADHNHETCLRNAHACARLFTADGNRVRVIPVVKVTPHESLLEYKFDGFKQTNSG